MKRSTLVFATAVAVSQMGATDCGQIIKDPGFDLWCGDRLCDWKIETGDAVQVPTWHAGDDGVELVGDDVAISQQTPETSDDSTCIHFSMLTDVALDADVHLQFDVFGDGTVDYDQPIPTAHWAPVSYLVRFTGPYNGVRFRIAKHGAGHAVLAEIKAETSTDCAGAAIALPPHPNGGFCDAADQCASGVCSGGGFFVSHGTCAACSTDAQCTGGNVCGIDDAVAPWLHPSLVCIPPASRRLGELCHEDAECATGFCNGFACSTCSATSGCGADEGCTKVDGTLTRPDGTTDAWVAPPSECDAALGKRATGEICFRDDDCASARCTGTGSLSVCDADGRTCESDLECPDDHTLKPTACLAVGITGGTCQ